MSAKQALLDYIETLSKDELESLWARIQADAAEYANIAPRTDEQTDSVGRGLAQLDAGVRIPHDEVLRRLNRIYG
jgi:predicted transcriptional regulator